MRLWSINPQYLDQQGLTALWREGLLAQKVLRGETRGYRNHPQLIRFQETVNPEAAIGRYLEHVYFEAVSRGFKYQREKILNSDFSGRIMVTRGQLDYEFWWLLTKLQYRQPEKYQAIYQICNPAPHPIFEVINGGIASWERVTDYPVK
ncbi:MAG: pyrimidine dimer DNA glycosylase/endonuclease V [Methylocystaceae bacterium]